MSDVKTEIAVENIAGEINGHIHLIDSDFEPKHGVEDGSTICARSIIEVFRSDPMAYIKTENNADTCTIALAGIDDPERLMGYVRTLMNARSDLVREGAAQAIHTYEQDLKDLKDEQ